MSAIAKSAPFVTWDEYLTGELGCDVRHEYVNGQVFAMAGGTDNHARIGLSVASELRQQLKGNPCEAFASDMRLRIELNEDEIGYYPDGMVVCDSSDANRLYREKPTVLIEVLSKSTERTDRFEKLNAYRSIDSLQEYIIIEQGAMRALIYRRSANWIPQMIEGEDAAIELPSIECSLAFADIYERVDWSEPEPDQEFPPG